MKSVTNTAAVAQRLKTFRKRKGITQQLAAERLNMARTTIVAIENGERSVRDEEITAFAALYEVSVHEILRSVTAIKQINLQFRGKIAPEGQERLEAECRILAEDYLYVESLRSAPLSRSLPPEVAPGEDPARAARMAAEEERRRLGLGLEPITSMRNLLEDRLGVRVLQFSLEDAGSVAAVYFYDDVAGPVVCLNARQGWRRRRLSCAHELGHVIGSRESPNVLGTETQTGPGRRPAAEAFSDAFQRHFLMPTGALERFTTSRKRERGGKFVPNDIVELADSFGVSFEAMCRALETDELIKKGTADYLLAKRFDPRYGKGVDASFAADASPLSMSSRFRRLAVAAHINEQISEGTLAKLLRTDRSVARQLVMDLADEEERSASRQSALSEPDSERES